MSKLDEITKKLACGVAGDINSNPAYDWRKIHRDIAKAEIKSLMLDVYKESIVSDNFTHLEFEKKVEEL